MELFAFYLRNRRSLMNGLSIVVALLLTFLPGTNGLAQQNQQSLPQANVLLLYSGKETDSDIGYEKVVAFYGLSLVKVDIASTPVTDALLNDSSGYSYLGVFIDGTQVDDIGMSGAQALRNAINSNGLNVMIGNFVVDQSAVVETLTEGEITGSTPFSASSKNYTVTTTAPEVTQQLSGINVRHATESHDHQLVLGPSGTHTQVLVLETDDSGKQAPLFVRYTNGKGSVFVVSNYTDPYLRTNLLAENFYVQRSDGGYYTQQWFAQITPLFMFVRYIGGDYAWHTNHHFANFTLDDPKLQQAAFDYAGMLQQEKSHHFHFTLAAVPATINEREPSVVELFARNPDYLSLVQHGNNHDGYEFYRYVVTPTDTYPARPFTQQVQNIEQGRASMQTFTKQTSIPYGQIMIFPYNISPSQTLTVLKENNFQATINSSDVPLDTKRSRRWDASMYPAEMSYNDFAVMLRYGTGQSPYPFLFFLGKPVLEYDHIARFANGIDAYDPYADAINAVHGGNVEWKSLDYILKHMYFEKLNRDGSMSVMFWGNNIVLTNETKEQHVYHVQKEETLNVPIQMVTLNDVPTRYTVANDLLNVDLSLAPGDTRNVLITYSSSGYKSPFTVYAHRDSVFLPVIIRLD